MFLLSGCNKIGYVLLTVQILLLLSTRFEEHIVVPKPIRFTNIQSHTACYRQRRSSSQVRHSIYDIITAIICL